MLNEPILTSLLCCPACQGDLEIYESTIIASDQHIIEGQLKCSACSSVYPILNGVPRFVQDKFTTEVSQTIKGFGYEWKQANPVIQNKRFTAAETFLDFIKPVEQEYFQGKVVLDAGCGSARFTSWAQKFGASVVVGVDLS